MRTTRTRTAGTALLSALVLVVLTGCSSVYDLPLPGGPRAEGRQITVRAEFADVLDLVPRSSVKVDEVTVGEVTDIELDGWTARVTMRIPASAGLPDDTRAELKQTSLLGEKYIALERPDGGGSGSLDDGDLIPLDRTGRNPEVEEVLAALSMLLNGGGVGQLKVIESELNNALRGHHEEIRSLIAQLDTFVGGLDEQKAEIVRAIDGIDRLSASLAARDGPAGGRPRRSCRRGSQILADQREQLTEMLTALDRLGEGRQHRHRGLAGRRARQPRGPEPILAQLNTAGDDLPEVARAACSPTRSRTPRCRRSRATTPTCTSPPTSTCANLGVPAPTTAPHAARADPARPDPAGPHRHGAAAEPPDPDVRRAPADPVRRPALPAGLPRQRLRRRGPLVDDALHRGARVIRRLTKVQLVAVPRHHRRRDLATSRRATSGSPSASSAAARRSSPTSRSSGGIFVGAEVTYRGVRVGRVSELDPERRRRPGPRPARPRHRGPEGHPRRRREPLRGGGAVPRPPAALGRDAVPRRRRRHPAAGHRDPAPRRPAAPRRRPHRPLGAEGRPLDGRRRARHRVRGHRRRPGPAHRQRRRPDPQRDPGPAGHHRAC